MAFSQAARDAAARTRQENKEKRAAEKLMSTGVGPSKIFCDPNAIDRNAELRECHIEGRLIKDHYTEDQIAILQWAWTDEGYAARNEGKSPIRASVTEDPLQKSLQKRRDDVLERDMQPWQAESPMAEVLKQNERPGFRQKFLADGTVKHQGLRGWRPVIKDGQPVTLGTLKLAEMPIENAEQRNAHFRERGNQQLRQVQEQYVKEAAGTAKVEQ